MSNWKNVPEGVLTVIALRFDGPRPDVIRALRAVCKPWNAEITAGITRATMLEGAEAPVWQVLQKTPKLQCLTVVGSKGEASKTLLAEIRIVKKLVPELNSFVFSDCELSNCSMPLSACLGKNTRELTIDYCDLNYDSIEDMDDFQHLIYLKLIHRDEYDNNDLNHGISNAIFTLLPSLQTLSIQYFPPAIVISSNLPNLTSLSINNSIIESPEFLRGLLRLEHIDLNETEFLHDDAEFVREIPESITSLSIYKSELDESTINYEGIAERLASLTSLRIGRDDDVTDEELAAFGSMPSLTRLSVADCDNVTNYGLMSLARSANMSLLEIKRCEYVTQEGVDALRAAVPGLDIVFEEAV